MADDDVRISRREWLAAGASLGVAGVVLPGCVASPAPPSATPCSKMPNTPYDVAIIGGGPAGLSAALALGRARKHVLLFDAGPRRNAAAEQLHNFVTRDGTPPEEFRRVAREQLVKYPNVDVRDARVEGVGGHKGAFRLVAGADVVHARRVLLCVGMIDEALPLEGFREHWGRSIFACPYCHGWEVQDRPWGYLARPEHAEHVLPFSLLLRGWTRDVVVFTNAELQLPASTHAELEAAGVRLETAPLSRLVANAQGLQAVELSDGTRVACEVLFARPPQRQTELVETLGLAHDAAGFVAVDAGTRESSVAGIHASGDLTTSAQGALSAAADGQRAAGAINRELTRELALSGLV